MKKLLYSIAFCFVINSAFAQQEVNFRMEVSNDSILLGNYFEVKFILENASGSQFEPPSFEGFTVIGGPNQASTFSMMNGKVSQSLSYSYYLKPQDIGSFYIEPASIKVGNEILETMPKKVLVVVNPDEIHQAPHSNNMESPVLPQEATPKSKKPKKKRKVYKI
jgi:oxygen tolerance protein BatD